MLRFPPVGLLWCHYKYLFPIWNGGTFFGRYPSQWPWFAISSLWLTCSLCTLICMLVFLLTPILPSIFLCTPSLQVAIWILAPFSQQDLIFACLVTNDCVKKCHALACTHPYLCSFEWTHHRKNKGSLCWEFFFIYIIFAYHPRKFCSIRQKKKCKCQIKQWQMTVFSIE